MAYNAKYALTFEETVGKCAEGKKTKRMLSKDILFILEKPYFKAKKIKEYGDKNIFRKNVCAGKLRIFYSITESANQIEFHFVRIKNKHTYEDL